MVEAWPYVESAERTAMLAHAVHNQYMTAIMALEPYSMSAFDAAELGLYKPIMRAVAPPNGSLPSPKTLDEPAKASADANGTTAPCRDDAMICERCGKAEMYRMHAVWRCPACGFKTDCCGW